MKKEIAEKWVAALRSGKYQQTQKTLCSIGPMGEMSFCCLGVLCHLIKPDGFEKQSFGNALFKKYSEELKREEISSAQLTESIRKECGMVTTDGYIPEMRDYLTHLNDSGDYDFNQIADVIEENWEDL